MKTVYGMICAAAAMAASPAVAGPKCNVNADLLGANYVITQQQGEAAPTSAHLGLWRRGDQVLHVHPASETAEVWTGRDGVATKFERYFDADKRAVEYYPSDFKAAGADRNFSMKAQLISQEALAVL